MKTITIAGIGLAIGGGVSAAYEFGVKPWLEARAKEAEDKERKEQAASLVSVALVPDGTIYYGDSDCAVIRVQINWSLTGRPVQAQTIEVSKTGKTFISTNECGGLAGVNINSTGINGQTAFWVNGAPAQVWVKVLGTVFAITIPPDLMVPMKEIAGGV